MGIFRRSALPSSARAALEADGILLLQDWIAGTVTYRDFRAPGRYSAWRKIRLRLALAASTRGLVVWGGRGPFVDVAWTAPQLAHIAASVREGLLVLAWDASVFQPTWSGSIELHLHCSDPDDVLALLRSHAPQLD